MYDQLGAVINGSLLHDIGKIIYRNDHSYGNHSDAGSKFIQNDEIKIAEKKTIIECIKYHHHHLLKSAKLSESHPAYIVYEADNIASGIDRREIYDNQSNMGFNEKIPLHSIFNELNSEKNNFKGAYPLTISFDKNDIKLPVQEIDFLKQTTTQSGYGSLVSLLNRRLKELNGELDSPNSVLKILEAVGSTVPSSTSNKEIPDISLYDHSKITCAIASCMYLYAAEKGVEDFKALFFNSKEFRKTDAFVLVSGDLSGIQDFIYTIASKGALKSLRGRSFFLEIIIENIVDEILEEQGLSRANLIYSGGGHFYILMPNTEESNDLIIRAKEKINADLLEMFGISLYLELGSQKCSADDIGNGLDVKKEKENKLGKVFESVSKQLSKGKIQRYDSDLLSELFNQDSIYNKKTQNEKECIICGESDNLVAFQGNEEQFACENCNDIAELGKTLAKSNTKKGKVLVSVVSENGTNHLRIPSINSKAYMKLEELDKIQKNISIKPDSYKRVYSINELMTGFKYATHLWVGNYNKRTEDEKAVEFKELVKASQGIKRIGVLRADVDDLGKAFTRGFERPELHSRYDNVTISRSATFSREMSMFFKYEINKLCNGKGDKQFSFKLPGNPKNLLGGEKNVVVVYAGGDDVFVVGPWDEIIEFAVNLRNAFKKFSLNRLSLSCGIGIFDGSHPISQMARQTGELEDAAKSERADKGMKDAVALFGIENGSAKNIYQWDEFINDVCNDKMNRICSWFLFDENEVIEKSNKFYAGMSLLYKLHQLFSNEEEINIARLAYLIGRMKPSEREVERLETYDDMKKSLYCWILEEADKRQTATALNLLIYLNRKE